MQEKQLRNRPMNQDCLSEAIMNIRLQDRPGPKSRGGVPLDDEGCSLGPTDTRVGDQLGRTSAEAKPHRFAKPSFVAKAFRPIFLMYFWQS